MCIRDSGSSMNTTINVAFSQYTILDVVQVLEKITGKKAHYTLTDQWWSYHLDTSEIAYMLPDVQPNSDIDYLEWMLNKYYANNK